MSRFEYPSHQAKSSAHSIGLFVETELWLTKPCPQLLTDVQTCFLNAVHNDLLNPLLLFATVIAEKPAPRDVTGVHARQGVVHQQVDVDF